VIAQFFNQHSFLLLPVFLLIAAAAVLIWRKARPAWWGAWALTLVGVAAFVLLTREPQTARVKLDTAADIRTVIQTAGRPTLVEFYSNY
jgi:TRAP-type uncharacterized transport system fused permease subunit